MVNVGLLGLGKMGISHLAILNSLSNVKVVAVAESNHVVTRAMVKYSGIKAYTDYKKMLSEEPLDGIVICLPNDLHYQACLDAIDRNVSFFVEKPFTLSPSQSGEVVRRAQARGIHGMVGYVNRYTKIFEIVKNIIDNGLLGYIYDYRCSMLGSVVHGNSKENWRSSTKMGGGCLFDYGSHCIDLAIYFFGRIVDVLTSELKSVFSKNCEDMVRAVVKHEGGLTGSIYVNWCDENQRKAYNEVEILGTKGRLVANKQDIKLFLTDPPTNRDFYKGWNSRHVTDYIENVPFYLRGEEFTKELVDFVASIDPSSKGESRMRSSIEDAYLTDVAIDMIRNRANKINK